MENRQWYHECKPNKNTPKCIKGVYLPLTLPATSCSLYSGYSTSDDRSEDASVDEILAEMLTKTKGSGEIGDDWISLALSFVDQILEINGTGTVTA